jgi:zinc-ribbon family
MIIIFGLRRMLARLGTVFVMCASCGSPAAHAIVRTRRWFTLFFVPVIPFSTKFLTTCALCGHVTQITKEGADHYVASAQQHAAASRGATVPSPPPVVAGVAATLGPPPAEPAMESPAPEAGDSPSDT